ncbi:MAG TPA: TIM-barrel domain-containing protein, partial [Polyangiaceae bacterium]|nr:TIM-barrel domain-containing protein [Polyangiaceae bacterium]
MTFEPPPLVRVPGGSLALEFCASNVVRVAFAPDAAFFARPTLATAARRCEPTAWRSARSPGQVTYTTSRLGVRVETTGRVTFLDPDGQAILTERPNGGRTLTPAIIQAEATFNVRQEWEPNADESLYGLGQHQQGLFDIKDYDLDLRQYNTEIYVPFLVSSRGYGILWDNTSFTRFGDPGDAVPLPGTIDLYKSGGAAGEVDPRSGMVTWSGMVTPEVTGDTLFRAYYSGSLKLVVDGHTVIDHFRQSWLPNEDFARVQLSAGKPVEVRLEWQRAAADVNIVRLLWKPPVPDRSTSLWSRVGNGVDYTFVYGPELDDVVAGYRRLTGEAPMMPRWAYGFWMSRERYKTARETLDVLAKYRARRLPIDNIVQDWQYWKAPEWGSHSFDPDRFPDVDAWVKTVHDTYHAQLMLSVWAKFHTGTQNFAALNGAGYLYQRNLTEQRKDHIGYTFTYYDAFNPAARQLYWSQIEQALLPKGFDAWWVDASEPEIVQDRFPSVAAHVATSETHMHPTALGTGSRMLNAYSLVQSQAIFEGLSAAQPDKRPFILTRNGFAGQQRYAAASWSSDVSSTWTSLQRQVPAGLSFCLSGIPYWTLDIGGFAVPARFSQNPSQEALTEWYELNTRWFELGTFLPLM